MPKPPRKPFRPTGDRPFSDRPRSDKPFRKPFRKRDEGDEPPRATFHEKSDQSTDDRPRLYRREGGEDRRPRDLGDKPFRKPFRKREDGDAPPRFRDRGDRPPPRGDRPFRDKPFRERPPREEGDRPFRARPPREDGDRPFRAREDRPQGDRPYREPREFGDKPQGDRPFRKARDFGDRKPFKKRDWSDEKPAPKPDNDFPASRHTPNAENDLIHGHHAVAAALLNDKRKHVHLWTTENAMARLIEENVTLPSEIETVHPRLLDHMLRGQDAVHQGILLESEPLKQPQLNQIEKGSLIVLLDQVTDPHNVGAILRSCAAFGVAALVSPARNSAETNGALLKAASGAYEHVPMVKVTNLARAIEELKGYGFHIVGLDSEAELTMDQAIKTRPLALVLGAEGKGLRELTRETCDQVARLDMPGAIKSLNVSVATAISLYALTR